MYSYRCEDGHVHDEFRRMVDRNIIEPCPECGKPAERFLAGELVGQQINRSFIGSTKMPGYECPVTGEYVTTKQRRNEIFKQHGLHEAGDDTPARRARRERKAEALDTQRSANG